MEENKTEQPRRPLGKRLLGLGLIIAAVGYCLEWHKTLSALLSGGARQGKERS